MADTQHHDDNKSTAAPTSEIGPRRLVSKYTDGGHEIDEPNGNTLFLFLAILAGVVVLSALGIYQLFSAEAEKQMAQANARPAVQLIDSRTADEQLLAKYGKLSIDGQELYRMPIVEARSRVLNNGNWLKAFPAPKDWKHPDD